MEKIFQSLFSLALVLAMSAGAVMLAGCASSSPASSASASASASVGGEEAPGSDEGSDEQADCYGDDLPAIKSGKSQA